MDTFLPRAFVARWLLVTVVGALTSAVSPDPVVCQQGQDEARRLAEAALEAMGGTALWRDLPGIRFESIGHAFWFEQSERPDGPWIVGYEQTTFTMDHATGRVRRVVDARSIQTPEWTSITTILDGKATAIETQGRAFPAPPTQSDEIRELRAVLPDRALLAALDAANLRLEANVMLQGVPHRVIAYDTPAYPVRILLNRHTGLPTAIETLRRPDDVYAVVWGDTPKTFLFSLWSLEPGGYLYPRQWDVEELGERRTSATVTSIEFSPEVDPNSLRVSDAVRQMPDPFAGWSFRNAQLGQVRGQPAPAIEVAPGIVVLPGPWNTALIAQEDGVVVLESPISSEYSEQVIAEAGRRFPNLPIKAVISTSDAWPHVSGVRPYVANGTPIHALDLNIPLLQRLARAEHRRVPDRQSVANREADIRPVSSRTVVGGGANRVELYPMQGEGGERMVAVYFPTHRLLYASDLVQKLPDGTYFWPEYLVEVASVVAKHGLDVETVFAMHTMPTPWADVLAAIEAARSPSSD